MNRTPAFIAAQVAVEAVANEPEAYDEETRAAVLAFGQEQEVADFYLAMIR